MDRSVRIAHGFDEADRADEEFYASVTPQQRVDLLLEMIAAYTESLGEAAQGFERVHRIVELSQS